MKEVIESNRTMECRRHPAPSCDILTTIDPEELRKSQMSRQTLEIEIKEESTEDGKYEKESTCSNFMYPYKPLDSLKYINYYDSKDYVFELKKEFPDDENPQSDCNMNNKIVSENMELRKIENTEVGLSLNIKEENVNTKHQVSIKMERIEEQDILYNTEATSIHYDVLVTPQEVPCKLCGRIFINSFKLLKHNNGHLKVDINALGDTKYNESRRNCNKPFVNQDNMFSHDGHVHSKKIFQDELCEKQFKSVSNHNNRSPLKNGSGNSLKCKYCNVDFENRFTLCNHLKICRPGTEDEEIKYKCDSCDRSYKMKNSLTWHIRKAHYDYGRTFDCWCGRQLRTPIHLNEHKRLRHVTKVKIKKNEEHKCKHCEAVFSEKPYLSMHMKRVHCDYGKIFECWCGKEFRTPIHLREHKSRQHAVKIKIMTINDKIQCDSCHKYFKTKTTILRHMKKFHCDYGEVFQCWCGRRFLTAILLDEHRSRLHGGKVNGEFQCDFCQRIFKHKHNLIVHLKRFHFDYGKST